MNSPNLKMYCICNFDQDGNFIRYNLPFVAMTDAYAESMVYAAIKDAIGSQSFDGYSLVHVGYFIPDQVIMCLNGCDEFNVVVSVAEIIEKYRKESSDV